MVALDQFLELKHYARATQRRGRGPCRERSLCCSDGLADFIHARERHAARDFAARGVVDVAEAIAGAGDLAPVDVVMELLHLRAGSLDWLVHAASSSKTISVC